MLETSDTAALIAEAPDCPSLASDTAHVIEELRSSLSFYEFLKRFVEMDVNSPDFSAAFESAGVITALPAARALRFGLGLRIGQLVQHVAGYAFALDPPLGIQWRELADLVHDSPHAAIKSIDFFKQGTLADEYRQWQAEAIANDPHAIYPTSPFRSGDGHLVSGGEYREVEAVMSCRTHTSIRVVENVLGHDNRVLRDVYKPLGRCVCLIDQNVEKYFGFRLESYFAEHAIELEKLVYRAMEVDKGIGTVEKMLGDFKHLGVLRNEPVLVVGGGVLSDTAGLACALYHRGTPYVMLSTSVVAGIDAGPSPRTCCDGFGYKNLFGAYHPPILSITDRSFFKTLHSGWLRHGLAEIIKMAVVKDIELFDDMERTGPSLITTRFASTNENEDPELNELSQRILGRAIKSYVEAEYGNLYETHQCRPHAFGHTWSPGFEIAAGLLHGHAVSTGMGWGAFLSHKMGWIDQADMTRIHDLIQTFGLSLWHGVLEDRNLMWASQLKMTEKRGGHLAAPLPMQTIGECGYLDKLSERDLSFLMQEYRRHCQSRPGDGIGVDPHCHDVGLEDPSTVGVN